MRIIPLVLAVLALAGATAAPTASAQVGRTPEAVAQALQERYGRVRDFSADFEQSYRGGALRTQVRERGTVVVKKPGKMRWVYTDPERKEIVSDGSKLYMYFPDERRVIVNELPPDGGASTGATFLAGKGDVTRDFTAEFADNPPSGTVALKLTPRTPQQEYEYLVVVLDPATLQIRALTTLDGLGGENTLTFTNLKENRGVSDGTFAFRPPRGVTVTDGSTL